MMKLPFILRVAAVAAVCSFAACSDSNMQKDADGNYVVNTTELGKEVKGYAAQTPLNVTISPEGAIVKVEALDNNETPEFFGNVQANLLPKFEGKTSTEGIDGVTGATFSSRAVIKNVQLALDYYNANK